MSFSTSDGAVVGDFKRMMFPLFGVPPFAAAETIGAGADRGAIVSSLDT
jgi:hypothetical protein